MDKVSASRMVHHATARVEKTPGDYARHNKMFATQKMCEQRAFDMDREDERMAMLRKKQEIEIRFGAPRSTHKPKYKDFNLKDTAEFKGFDKSSGPPRSPRRVLITAQGERVVLPPALTVPERHELSLQKHMAHQQQARRLKRPSKYPQFGMKEEVVEKKEDFHVHVKKTQKL